jgi:hypothetical protein
MEYPQGFGLKFLGTLEQDTPSNNNQLFTDIKLQSINKEQKFTFNLVMDKLIKYKEDPSILQPLRLIVTGTAGSGKSF